MPSSSSTGHGILSMFLTYEVGSRDSLEYVISWENVFLICSVKIFESTEERIVSDRFNLLMILVKVLSNSFFISLNVYNSRNSQTLIQN